MPRADREEYERWAAETRNVAITDIIPPNLKRQGDFVGPCPRCGGDDEFSVQPDEGIFNCRGCGGGKGVKGVISLAKFMWNCDFNSAVEKLTNKPKPNGKDRAAPTSKKIASAADEPTIDWKHPQEIFDYTDRDGNLIYQNIRYRIINADGTPVISPKGKPDKTFRLRRRQGTRWVTGLGDKVEQNSLPITRPDRGDRGRPNHSRVRAGRRRQGQRAAPVGHPRHTHREGHQELRRTVPRRERQLDTRQRRCGICAHQRDRGGTLRHREARPRLGVAGIRQGWRHQRLGEGGRHR